MAKAIEALVGRISRNRRLDIVGQALGGTVGKFVKPGPVKDLLSGTWLGHALHPLLTDLPIGSFTSAMALDLLGGEEAAGGAQTLIGLGILSTLPTALSGLSDLSDVYEERDRAVGAAHALGNTAALACYGLSYLARRRGRRGLGMFWSFAGGAAMGWSAYLGGHLSLRRGIGVNHTAFEEPIADWTAVLDDKELQEGEAKNVSAGSNQVVLYRFAGEICALSDVCNHAGGPLHEGDIDGLGVTCPWHASRFDLTDGSVLRGPATAPQPSYETRVQDGKIEVRSRS
jgi:nitrite reductase/ring-hydroxylating ferredoxin subunit/uncharacterized membrane protein